MSILLTGFAVLILSPVVAYLCAKTATYGVLRARKLWKEQEEHSTNSKPQ